MKSKPRLLLVGLGRQGGEHLTASIELEKRGLVEVVGLCDKSKNYVARKGKEFSKNFYTDHKKAFQETSPDIAILSLPNFEYHRIRNFFLSRGVHVLQEKPFAITLKQARKARRLANENHCYLRIAQQRLYHPFYIKAEKWIKRLGKISFYDYSFTLNDTNYSWYWDKKKGGGSWFGLGWHACFVLRYLLGLPYKTKVNSVTTGNRDWEYKTDDTNIFEATYKDGTVARIFTSVVSPKKSEKLFIQGSNGHLTLDREHIVLYNKNGKIIKADNTPYEWLDAYKKQLNSFLKLTKQNKNKEYCSQFDLDIMRMVQS